MSTKGCAGVFLFCLDLQLFAKIKKDLVSTQSIFTFLLITQDPNKIKEIPNSLFQTLLCRKRVQNFSKKKLNSMVVEVVKVFNFSDKKTWSLGNNRPLIDILQNLISITKL